MIQTTNASRHIAIFIDSLSGGGAEKVMLTLANAMAAMGHRPHIISLDKNLAYDVAERVPVDFLYPQNASGLRGRSKLNKHVKKLKELVDSIEADSGKFDLYLSNLEETHRIVAGCNFNPCFYVMHNSIEETLKRLLLVGPIKYFYFKYLLRFLNGKHLISVSNGVGDEIKRVGRIKPASVQTIYNPFNSIEIVELANQSVTGLPSEPYIIHVGRTAKQKRLDILFKALTFVEPSIRLVCLCRNVKKAKKIAIKNGVLDRVIFPGFQKNPYPWIKNAKALVLSSDFEGFACVLVEALICGTTPVSTRCNYGPSEIMTGNLAELLSPVGDEFALAQNINKALTKNYSFDLPLLKDIDDQKIAQKYLDLIDRLDS
jgi:glycosyltransferase involved in cell wall biosynthesis